MLNKGKVKKINTNISLGIELKKQLQIYAINNDTNLSEILNKAGQTYLNTSAKAIKHSKS